MPAPVVAYADMIRLRLPRLETVALTPESTSFASYPFPWLVPSGEEQDFEFHTYNLENDYLKVSVVPGLGGRIVSLFEKETGREHIAPPTGLVLDETRGQRLDFGIEVQVWQNHIPARRENLGPVQARLDDGDVGMIELYEFGGGLPVGWRLRIAITPESRTVGLDFRAHSRALEPISVDFGLRGLGEIPVRFSHGLLQRKNGVAQRGLDRLGAFATDVWQAELLAPEEQTTTSPNFGDTGSQAGAYAQLAAQAFGEEDFAGAADHLESALLYAGDHPLLWWMRALAQRMAGTDPEEALLNAHYLAPLEPCLRAESFLASNHQTSEPSMILDPLNNYPDALVEPAAWLVTLNLPGPAHAWIDEALRHRELPALRYFLGQLHLKYSGMRFEAAEQLARAAKAPINPPYPWRDAEADAIRNLAATFPNDARLKDLSLMLSRAQSSAQS